MEAFAAKGAGRIKTTFEASAVVQMRHLQGSLVTVLFILWVGHFMANAAVFLAPDYYFYLVFDPEPKTGIKSEKTVRFCEIPIGVTLLIKEKSDGKLIMGVWIGDDYRDLVKMDASWAVMDEGELFLADAGQGEPVSTGASIPVKALVSTKQLKQLEPKACANFSVKERKRILAVEKAARIMAQAFVTANVSKPHEVLNDKALVEVEIEHSIAEPERESLYLKGSAEVTQWIKQIHAPSETGFVPAFKTRSLSSCSVTSCEFAIIYGIHHNTLYLTKLHFISDDHGDVFVSRIELYHGD